MTETQKLRYLINAIEYQKFYLFQQPIWDITLSFCKGTEVFLRIPEMFNGLYDELDQEIQQNSPLYWIGLAEKNQILDLLTLGIIQKIIKRQDVLNSKMGPYYINIPPPVINPTFVKKLKAYCEKHKFQFSRIGIELTEREPIQNKALFQRGMEELRSLGITRALDDYGCGFSTFSFLKYADVDRVKLDKQIIKNAQKNSQDLITILSLMNFAKIFNLDVIAEGIETMEDYNFAKSLGCDGVQGFLFNKPSFLVGPCSDYPVTTATLYS